jgi:hypothetical protein
MKRSRRQSASSAIMIGSKISDGGQTAITIKLKHPEVEHTIRIQEFERWLDASPRSPAEMVLKNRLRELLSHER